jgi:hypothetical protein
MTKRKFISILPVIVFFILVVHGFAEQTAKTPKFPFLFFKEKLVITLEQDEITVEGDYYFRNQRNGPARSSIFYPLPADETMPYPYYIDVPGRKFFKSSAGVHWPMTFAKPGDVQKVHVIYKQKLLTSRAMYIVASTRKWQTPLEQAEFLINYPTAWGTLKTSYPMEIVKKEKGRTYLRYFKRQFWPDKNMEFSWGPADRRYP